MTARFQALFKQTSIAIQIYNREGKCVEVNDAWEKLFHSKKIELEGYNVLEDPQVKASGVYDCFIRAFSGEVVHVPPSFYDPTLNGKQGRGRWLEGIFSPVKDDQGEVIEVAVIFNDITDLRRSQDQLKAILEHVPEGVLVIDSDHKTVYANTVAAKMAGLDSPDEWINRHASLDHLEFTTEDGKPFPQELLPSWRAFRGEENIPETNIRFLNKKTNEVRVSSVLASAIKDEKGVPYQVVVVYRDITDKMRIDTQLREALDSQNLFFSVASHELRTPLTALKLNTQLMYMTYPNISMDGIAKVDRQVGKLSRLVNEMLDMSRIARGKLELILKEANLSLLTKEVLYGMTEQLKVASITLTTDISENIIGNWDTDRLEQVVENLITNAIRYAPNCPLFVKLATHDGKVILEVCDQGPGISPEDIDKIFNRFARSRSFGERSGLGLGLYIVKEIVTLHGGSVSVSNLNTGGARFIVELPLR
jgi:PAS domain S-box-containing protein